MLLIVFLSTCGTIGSCADIWDDEDCLQQSLDPWGCYVCRYGRKYQAMTLPSNGYESYKIQI